MVAIEERQHCRSSHAKSVSCADDAPIVTTVGQSCVKTVDGLSAAASGGINFRQIYVQLGLISFHVQGGLAQFQSFVPFSVGPGDADSQKREIVRIRLRCIEGMTEIFNG